MFDWNDEELENIIWGEAGVSDDHIVPFPKGNDGNPQLVSLDPKRKECQQEYTKSKPRQNTHEVKIASHGSESGATSNFGANVRHSTSGFCMASSWPDLSSSNVTKTDQDMRIESNYLKEVTKPDSLRDKALFESLTDVLQNRHEDKEGGDFVDYGWANIGSFDDIDRFFSNDDPIFGHASLDNVGELWTSSQKKDNSLSLSVDSPSLELGVLNTASKRIDIKAEYGQHKYLPFTSGGCKLSDLKSHDLQNEHGFIDEGGHATAKSKLILKNQETLDRVEKATTVTSLITSDNATTLNKLTDKVNKRKKILKYRKNINERGKIMQGPCRIWFQPGSQFQRLYILPSRPSSALPQKKPLHGPDSSQYQHLFSPHVPPATYGNPVNQYTATPLLSNLHSEVSLGNINHMDNTVDACMKPLTMTPQEKIEKLRRRQQMQALLAIQKQQQQINNIVPSANPSFKENQNQLSEGADVKVEECLSNLPFDMIIPKEQDMSNTVSITADNDSLQGTILYELQNVVSKLDINERLCIRDSLFRLAQSSIQRHYTSDSSESNKTIGEEHQFSVKEEAKTHNGYPTMCGMETETNHTDRTVAHLLFHRQPEIACKQHRTPESPISTMGGLFSSSENMGSFLGTRYPCPVTEPLNGGDQYITSPCMDTSHHASDHDLVFGGSYGEASK